MQQRNILSDDVKFTDWKDDQYDRVKNLSYISYQITILKISFNHVDV